jgi:hypothetical protein
MKYMKNQSGYALVLALLVIVVFMIIALFLMGRSYSSVKQNKIVEKNYQSVALAEMGVSFFQLAVKNGFDSNKEDVLANMRNQMLQDMENDYLRDESYYISKALEDMTGRIEGYLSDKLRATESADGEKEATINIEDSLYKLSYPPLNPSSEEIRISFASLGIKGDKAAKLSGTMTIPMKALTDDSSNGDDVTNGGETLTFDKISRPDESAACTHPDKKLKKCPQYLFTDDSNEFSGNFNNGDIQLIYAYGSLDLEGNGNQAYIQQMHVERDLELNKNMNHSSIGLLEVKGDLILNSQFRLSDSKLFIKQNLRTGDDGSPGNQGGHFELTDNSFMYVGGTAEIGKKFTIDSGSTMCVGGGDIFFNKKTPQIDVLGKLYIKDTGGTKQSEVAPYYVDAEVFNKACGLDRGQIKLFDWGNIQKTVDYDYE